MRGYLEDQTGHNAMIEMFRTWKEHHHLPEGGSLYDQAFPLVVYFRVIQSALDEVDGWKRRQRENEQNAASRASRMQASAPRGLRR